MGAYCEVMTRAVRRLPSSHIYTEGFKLAPRLRLPLLTRKPVP